MVSCDAGETFSIITTIIGLTVRAFAHCKLYNSTKWVSTITNKFCITLNQCLVTISMPTDGQIYIIICLRILLLRLLRTLIPSQGPQFAHSRRGLENHWIFDFHRVPGQSCVRNALRSNLENVFIPFRSTVMAQQYDMDIWQCWSSCWWCSSGNAKQRRATHSNAHSILTAMIQIQNVAQMGQPT